MIREASFGAPEDAHLGERALARFAGGGSIRRLVAPLLRRAEGGGRGTSDAEGSKSLSWGDDVERKDKIAAPTTKLQLPAALYPPCQPSLKYNLYNPPKTSSFSCIAKTSRQRRRQKLRTRKRKRTGSPSLSKLNSTRCPCLGASTLLTGLGSVCFPCVTETLERNAWSQPSLGPARVSSHSPVGGRTPLML